jgi:hypothetical protein
MIEYYSNLVKNFKHEPEMEIEVLKFTSQLFEKLIEIEKLS